MNVYGEVGKLYKLNTPRRGGIVAKNGILPFLLFALQQVKRLRHDLVQQSVILFGRA
ncbi:MAG: hypothetical protein KIY09_02180 [Thermoplasmata archaeon]|nr:hypothetical protein [Candidatus Sysuiplasma acidicola]